MTREVAKNGISGKLNSWKKIANKTYSFFKKNPRSHCNFDACVQATKGFFLDVNKARKTFLEKNKETGQEDLGGYLQTLQSIASARKAGI